MAGVDAAEDERERRRRACERFNVSPYYELLGLRATCDAAGASRVELKSSERLLQLYGGVHGGALMSLADAAVNVALASTFEDDALRTATVQIDVRFLEPAGAGGVVAEGRVVRRGGRIAFADCVVRAGERVVATASAVLRVARAPAEAP